MQGRLGPRFVGPILKFCAAVLTNAPHSAGEYLELDGQSNRSMSKFQVKQMVQGKPSTRMEISVIITVCVLQQHDLHRTNCTRVDVKPESDAEPTFL